MLTLWASVVAKRLGFDEDEALSLGKALASLTAQAKGRRLGIFEPHEEKPDAVRTKERGEEYWIELLGRGIPATNTNEGIRAVSGAEVIEPEEAKRYLASKFGSNLGAVRSAMEKLANSYTPKELAARGFQLYEEFRPSIPEGVRGWGAKGDLDIALIEQMAKKK